jgi:hypothetical protein
MSPGWAVLAILLVYVATALASTRPGRIATAVVVDGQLLVTARGLKALWAFRRRVTVPISG